MLSSISELSGFSIFLSNVKVVFCFLSPNLWLDQLPPLLLSRENFSQIFNFFFSAPSHVSKIYTASSLHCFLLLNKPTSEYFLFNFFPVFRFFCTVCLFSKYRKGVQDHRSLQTRGMKPKCIISGSGGLSDTSACFVDFFLQLVLSTCGCSMLWVRRSTYRSSERLSFSALWVAMKHSPIFSVTNVRLRLVCLLGAVNKRFV